MVDERDRKGLKAIIPDEKPYFISDDEWDMLTRRLKKGQYLDEIAYEYKMTIGEVLSHIVLAWNRIAESQMDGGRVVGNDDSVV